MSQLLTSLLTVVFVVVMMFSISLAAGAGRAGHGADHDGRDRRVMQAHRRGMFVAQWRRTGALNAHIEETFSGHALVKVFGRQQEVEATFEERERGALRGVASARSSCRGLIMPTMMFIGNLNYVVIAVLGGLEVANGSMSLGDVQAFIQYSRQFTQPLTQVASMANLLQSGRRLAPSGSSSCSTPPSRTPTPPDAGCRGRRRTAEVRVRARVVLATTPDGR